jgi:hypothetical protein
MTKKYTKSKNIIVIIKIWIHLAVLQSKELSTGGQFVDFMGKMLLRILVRDIYINYEENFFIEFKKKMNLKIIQIH